MFFMRHENFLILFLSKSREKNNKNYNFLIKPNSYSLKLIIKVNI